MVISTCSVKTILTHHVEAKTKNASSASGD